MPPPKTEPRPAVLEHASGAMTMDTYGHLFENRLEEVADALDRSREQSQVDDGY